MRRTLLLAVLLLATQLSACGPARTVTILGPWTGAEANAFRAVLDVFRERTGIAYDYHGTGSLSSVLAAEVQTGTSPDVAVLPNPNELVNYQRQGSLHDISELAGQLRRSYSPQWLRLARAGTGLPYAVVVKANLKGLVWYNADALPGPPPATWAELSTLTGTSAAGNSPAWCLRLGATAAPGFPGTDWIEDILLRRSGPGVYQSWAAGELSWTDPRVRRAWETWGELVLRPGAVHGGRGTALLTDVSAAGEEMFDDPPGCVLEHGSSSALGDYRRSGGRFGFFPTPGPTRQRPRAWEVSADLAAMFRDTPQARELMRFLASDDAQRGWAAAGQDAAFTVNTAVADEVATGRAGKSIARILTTAGTLCYDASDLMPSAMTNAFYRAVLGYVADPGTLGTLLAELERVRLGVPPQDWANLACAGS